MRSGRLALAGLVSAALALGVPAAAEGPGSFRLGLDYSGRLVVKVLEIHVDATVQPAGFGAAARLRSSGVLDAFRHVDVRSEAEGRIVRGRAEPLSFHHQNLDGKSNRRVRASWTGQDVAVEAQPAFPVRPGDPPASRAERLEAVDPLTGLMRLTLAEAPGDLCRGTLKLFDGKQRYDLDFVARQPGVLNAREKRLGLTDPVRCQVRLREVAGFKKKPPAERNQGLKHPVLIGFAQLGAAGPWVISYLAAATPLGAATIELERVRR
jgi:hypothetical protein